jgi:protein BUR2
VAQKNPALVIDEQSKEYWRWRDSILMYEELMLELLTFDLMVENPYHRLFDLLGQLEIVHNKHLRQSAWAFLNDCCLTTLPLLMEARDIAVGAVFFASAHTKQTIDDVNGDPWWKYLKGDEDRCIKAIDTMRQFYTENPLRKQNPSLPSPAFHLENTRRHADTTFSQAETVSSTVGTPLEGEVGSQTPKAKVNGARLKDGLERIQENGANGNARNDNDGHRESSNGNGAVSPPKRRDADSGSESDRAQKRPRYAEDEGEVAEY